MSSEELSHDEAIKQFCGVTGADEERAKGLLEACDWNLELAVNMHVDTDDGRNNKPNSSSIDNSAAPGPSTSSGRHFVTLPDDEDTNNSDQSSSVSRPQPQASGLRTNYSAKRSNAACDPDDVRPPIPPVRQVLVQHSEGFAPDLPPRRYNTRTGHASDVYDAFRDFQAEARWQEMAQEGESSSSEPSASASSKRTLQELFRPPLDLMFRGSLTSAREAGSQQNKWLLVNIQDGREFNCQTLNRDVWSIQAVKDIVKEHFIFWQVYHDSFEGSRYSQFYKVRSFPHVSIIDPRTGEQMKSWKSQIDKDLFCDSVIEFLTEHPSPDGSTANTMKKLRVKEENVAQTLYDQSEEAQLEAAIKASLQESENSNSSKAFNDEDSYTDAIESDTDQTQSSFQAHTSNSLSSTFGKFNEKNAASNGQILSSVSASSRESCHPPTQKVENYHQLQQNHQEQPSTSAVAAPTGNDDSVTNILKFDDSNPATTIQIRLVDSSRLRVRVNLTNNIGDLVSHVRAKRPQYSETNFILATTFPSKELTDMAQTISEANLANASIVQKIKPQ